MITIDQIKLKFKVDKHTDTKDTVDNINLRWQLPSECTCCLKPTK